MVSILMIASCDSKEKTLIKTIKSLNEERTNISDSPSESSDNINDNMELILYHENSEKEEEEDKSIYDSMCFYAVSDSNRNESIIKSYLQEKDMYKENPDGEIHHDNQKLGEYYINEEKGKISFILRMWNNDSEHPKQVAISCSTVKMNDFKNVGYISYEYDENQNIVRENLFSNDNSLLANISYEYIPNIPFPIIIEYKVVEDNWSIKQLLNRNQKLWLNKDNIKFSKIGKIIGYKGDIFYPNNNNDYLTFNYNDKENIISIVGMPTNEYSSEYEKSGFISPTVDIDFSYGENNILESFTYNRPTIIYGTSDSTGEVLYDDKGRIVFNDFYITHGSISCFYFYENDEKRPWASITFDSMPYGGWEENGIEYMYGNNIITYIFQKE
jgi:hypothetical protein